MDWGLALATTATGLIVVFAVLLILVVIVSIFGKIMDSLLNKPKKKKEAQAAVTAPAKEETAAVRIEAEDGISEEVVAAISAAVAVMMSAEGKSYRIRSVKRAKENRPAWSAAGVQENTRPF